MIRKLRSEPIQHRLTCAVVAFTISVGRPQTADPLAGSWQLNLARTHYGGGAEPRTKESFVCSPANRGVNCTITSVRVDGRVLKATFTAAYDGKPYPTAGMPDVDQVSLRRVNDFIADATFSLRGKAAFAYRAVRSSSGRSLTIVAVDPITRAALESVVVYDRR